MHQAGFLPPVALPTHAHVHAQWRIHGAGVAHRQRRGVRTLKMMQDSTQVDVAPTTRVRLTPTPVELVGASVRDGSIELTAPVESPLVYAPSDAGCDLSELPVLSPCASLPTTTGAYALRDAHGVLLAVGCAPDVSTRVARHVGQLKNVAGVQVWCPPGADEVELEAACEYWLSSARELAGSPQSPGQAPNSAVGRRAVYAGVLAAFALHAIAKQAAWFIH